MVLAGKLWMPQKGTTERIASLQAHIASHPEIKQRLEEETKELSTVIALSDLHNALTKCLTHAKSRPKVKETFEKADSEDELPFA
jgi:phage shock protein A